VIEHSFPLLDEFIDRTRELSEAANNLRNSIKGGCRPEFIQAELYRLFAFLRNNTTRIKSLAMGAVQRGK